MGMAAPAVVSRVYKMISIVLIRLREKRHVSGSHCAVHEFVCASHRLGELFFWLLVLGGLVRIRHVVVGWWRGWGGSEEGPRFFRCYINRDRDPIRETKM